MGNLRPVGAAPILHVCSSTCGGDCEAIEQYVLHSLRNAVAKIQSFCEKQCVEGKKSFSPMQFTGVKESEEGAWKHKRDSFLYCLRS